MKFYDLSGADNQRFSPFGWRVRMSLAHLSMEENTEVELVKFSQKDKLKFSGQKLVPILRDNSAIISDSWRIAEYLENNYTNQPTLFSSPTDKANEKFVSSWVDSQVHPLIAKCVVRDIIDVIDPNDREYFRRSREHRFGMSLEEVVANREETRTLLKQTLFPVRRVLELNPFLGGTSASFADYSVFGAIMWARITSSFDILEQDDPIIHWRERMLDLYDGLARKETAREH
tara:strand:+ start:7213 stop:7905 length:693 start_codon:yes stop_codon:yes gene_type:complete